MKTPKSFKENLKNKIITAEMLGSAIYSVNKRAKNYRDREWNAGKYRFFVYSEKMKFYKMKEDLLSIVKPTKIHIQQTIERFKISNEYFETDEDFENSKKQYKDYIVDEVYDYFSWRNYSETSFYIVEKPKSLYFLLFEVGNYSFHSPIDEETAKNNKELTIENLPSDFFTYGADVSELVSVQFVKSLLNLIESKDFILKL